MESKSFLGIILAVVLLYSTSFLYFNHDGLSSFVHLKYECEGKVESSVENLEEELIDAISKNKLSSPIDFSVLKEFYQLGKCSFIPSSPDNPPERV